MSTNSNGVLQITGLEGVTGAKVAIVYTEWNEAIVAEQLKGCRAELGRLGAKEVYALAVPGCFEITFGCRQVWDHLQDQENAPEAIVAFGAVIRGGTPHFDYVCKAVTEGVLQLNLLLPIPVIFGVLTLDNEAQAWERLGGPYGHKGAEAAITAVKMIANTRRMDMQG